MPRSARSQKLGTAGAAEGSGPEVGGKGCEQGAVAVGECAELEAGVGGAGTEGKEFGCKSQSWARRGWRRGQGLRGSAQRGAELRKRVKGIQLKVHSFRTGEAGGPGPEGSWEEGESVEREQLMLETACSHKLGSAAGAA